MLKEIFQDEGIEFFSAVDYSECKSVNARLEKRLPFEPKSVLIFLLPYYAGECENLSLYAASLDYHIIIRDITDRIIKKLKEIYPVSNFAGFGDHSPIDERDCALKAGLGFIGDNGLIINEKYGSYMFLGDIITDVPVYELQSEAPPRESKSECHHCGACKRACPTGILRGEGFDCLSAITQRKGELTKEEKNLMIACNTAWGCDICQNVCPYNAAPRISPIELFHRDRISKLDSELLSSLSDEKFKDRAFSWRGRAVVERNVKLLENK